MKGVPEPRTAGKALFRPRKRAKQVFLALLDRPSSYWNYFTHMSLLSRVMCCSLDPVNLNFAHVLLVRRVCPPVPGHAPRQRAKLPVEPNCINRPAPTRSFSKNRQGARHKARAESASL